MAGADLIAAMLEVVARNVGSLLGRRAARLAASLRSDLPLISGHWIARFEDPTPDGNEEVSIEAHLRQIGRRVEGVAHLHGSPTDLFEFHGFVKRNVFYGSYARLDSHVLAGTGTFVLKVAATSKKLSGHCIWYDAILDDVWVSPYSWERVG